MRICRQQRHLLKVFKLINKWHWKRMSPRSFENQISLVFSANLLEVFLNIERHLLKKVIFSAIYRKFLPLHDSFLAKKIKMWTKFDFYWNFKSKFPGLFSKKPWESKNRRQKNFFSSSNFALPPFLCDFSYK